MDIVTALGGKVAFNIYAAGILLSLIVIAISSRMTALIYYERN